VLAERPVLIYAIGDVHGCLAELLELERLIVADAAKIPGEKLLITLGDYIDRGPDSAGVIAHLMSPPPDGFRRIALVGNHEQMLLDFLTDPVANGSWLDNGAEQTFTSYGAQPLSAYRGGRAAAEALSEVLPVEHMEFLAGLPVLVSAPGFVFAHAGVAPGVPLEQQTDADLMWIRQPFLKAETAIEGAVVVHGHTPGKRPVVTPARIDIDTTAFATGRLTAARIPAEGEVSFLATEGRAA
jgi:serine/threonine protein phosphatase 1